MADTTRQIMVEAAWKDTGVDAGLSRLNATMAQSEAAAHKNSGAYQEMTSRLSVAGSNITKLETQTQGLALVQGKAGDAAKDHAKGLSGLGNAMGTNIATLAKYTIGIYGAFQAFSALKSGIEGSIKDAIAAEHADRQLAFALDAAGQSGGNAQAKINAFASTLQKTIGISDETSKAIIAMGLNAGLTAEQAKRLEKAALDLSSATGRDLESSAQALIKSLSGVKDRTLATVQGFRDLTEDQMRAGEGIDLVAKRYAGAAERMANSTEGMAIRVKASLGELREAFGASLLTGMEGITGKLGGFQGIIDRLTASIKAFTSVMGAMNTAMQNLPGVGNFFQREAGPLAGPIGLLSNVTTRPGQSSAVQTGTPFGSIAHPGIDALDAAAAKAGGSLEKVADPLKNLKDTLAESTKELTVAQANLAVQLNPTAENMAKFAAALNAGKSAAEIELETKIKAIQVQTTVTNEMISLGVMVHAAAQNMEVRLRAGQGAVDKNGNITVRGPVQPMDLSAFQGQAMPRQSEAEWLKNIDKNAKEAYGGFFDKIAEGFNVNEQNAKDFGIALTDAFANGSSALGTFAQALLAIFGGGGPSGTIDKIFGAVFSGIKAWLGVPQGWGEGANPGGSSGGGGWNTGGTWSASAGVAMAPMDAPAIGRQPPLTMQSPNPGFAEWRALRHDLRAPQSPMELQVNTNQTTRRELARWLRPEIDRSRSRMGI